MRGCLQQVEKYDSGSSSVCSEEDEEEEEDGLRLVSAHYARAAADVPWTDVLSALMLRSHPPFCLLNVCLSQMMFGISLSSDLAQFGSVDARFAVVHLGGVCVSLRDGWRALVEHCLYRSQRVGRSLVVAVVVRIVSAHL